MSKTPAPATAPATTAAPDSAAAQSGAEGSSAALGEPGNPSIDNGSASELEAIRDTIVAGAPAPIKVRIGDSLRLTSKFGPMEHPFTGVKFGVDGGKKVQVDAWIKLQVEAGKLVQEAE